MATDYWQIVEPVWDVLAQWEDVTTFRSAFDSTEASARTLFAAHWLYSEVSNGGFHQFYWNSTGILAPEASEAYAAIGMPRTAETIRQSISWFPAPYPRERETRVGLLERYSEAHGERSDPFASLTDEFYDVVEVEKGGFIRAANEFVNREP